MRHPLTICALLAACAATAPAAALTIDFNSLHVAGGGYNYVYGPYREDGFTLTAASCQATNRGPSCFVTPQSFQSIDPAGASIITQFASQTSTLTRDNGGLFTVTSIDVAEYFDYGTFGSDADVQFTFTLADGTVATRTRTINTVGRYPVNTLVFDLGPVSAFAFLPTRGTSGSLQFDNIVIADAVAAVPEVSTWAMMIAGFGLVGTALRRRAATVRFA